MLTCLTIIINYDLCGFMESSTAEGLPPRWRTHRRRLVHTNLKRVECGNTRPYQIATYRVIGMRGWVEKKREVEESIKEER